jgi:hypothetical protein
MAVRNWIDRFRQNRNLDPRTEIIRQEFLLQGCQIVYFQTKNPNLGTFWSVLQWKILVNFMAILFTAISYILRPFGTFCGHLDIHMFPVLVCCTNKIWQPCSASQRRWHRTSVHDLFLVRCKIDCSCKNQSRPEAIKLDPGQQIFTLNIS